MSGLVGIIDLDGAPVDRELLHRMTASLRFRGPDAENHWVGDSAGFGHTLLKTTFEADRERQPCSLDGDVFIVADARVDDRAGLISKLESRDLKIPRNVSDPELILHAYAAWGRRCVAHLLGDFAFALWDQRRGRFFCARDPLGVKPFYYAVTGRQLVFSNTLDCIRLHPEISDALNERAIGDFLLFGYNQDQATTTFAGIHRLPGGHTLSWGGGKPRIERYWEAPADGTIRYSRPGEYVDHFRQLFRTAVADRLRTREVGILMSGGLDSTSIAATAQALLSEPETEFKIGAFTTVFDRLIPDEERNYAGLVADALGIDVDFTVADDYPLIDGSGTFPCRPEPVYEPGLDLFSDQLNKLTAEYRTVLTGWDGDAFLNDPVSRHFAGLISSGKLGRWLTDVSGYIRAFGRRPPLGLRTALARAVGKDKAQVGCPRWLDLEFAKQIDAGARMAEVDQAPASAHPFRPLAHGSLSLPVWSQIFEFFDPGATGLPLEARHPFVDLRLIRFLLSIPPVPYCMDKYLLREAMRGVLPEPVRRRPKSPLAADPHLARLRNGDGLRLRNYRPGGELSRFVRTEAIFDRPGEMDSDQAETALRVVSLDRWLNRLKFNHTLLQPEISHEHS